MSYQFDEGEGAVLTARFRNSDRQLEDPDDVYFHWIDPDGVQHTWHYGIDSEVVRLDEGVYVVVLPVEAGRTKTQWQAVSAGVGITTVSAVVVLCATASEFVGV